MRLALTPACTPAQKWDAAEGLLYVCRKLLSQPYIAPVLSALLYQWMLTHKDAGGAEQRQKHVNLLVAGVASHVLPQRASLAGCLCPLPGTLGWQRRCYCATACCW